jgi:hypothetical protein
LFAGSGLTGISREEGKRGICTAGWGSRRKEGELRGTAVYQYFTLTAGHCFPAQGTVGRENFRGAFEGTSIGKVTRGPYSESESFITDAEAVTVAESLRSHSVLNNHDGTLAIQPVQGAEQVLGGIVCWSGVSSGSHCGEIEGEAFVSGDGSHETLVYEAKGPAAQGDSGGPVWDPETHEAVGIMTTASPGPNPGENCERLPSGSITCPRLQFTPLEQPAGTEAPGALRYLGVEVLGQG